MSGGLVFITGASSGIGQALAARFHAAGFRLALVARRGDEVARWAGVEGWDPATYAVYGADVRDVAAITSAGRACIAAQGLPDVVIANAGISVGVDTAIESDLEVIRATLDSNPLVGNVSTVQLALAPTPCRCAACGTAQGKSPGRRWRHPA